MKELLENYLETILEIVTIAIFVYGTLAITNLVFAI